MSFVDFLGQVGRMAFGYLGGFIMLFLGATAFANGNDVIGAIAGVVGIVLLLFGVYNEREF